MGIEQIIKQQHRLKTDKQRQLFPEPINIQHKKNSI